MNTFINHENHNVNTTLSFHTETLYYQKSDFRAIGTSKGVNNLIYIRTIGNSIKVRLSIGAKRI